MVLKTLSWVPWALLQPSRRPVCLVKAVSRRHKLDEVHQAREGRFLWEKQETRKKIGQGTWGLDSFVMVTFAWYFQRLR